MGLLPPPTSRGPGSGADRAIVAYLVLALTTLIVLRATVESLAFLSVGWMLALALIPLTPWLLPRLGEFLREISPYVQSLKLGIIELDLRTLTREPITVPSSGVLAAVPNDLAALSTSTFISELVKSLHQLRREGGGPVGIIDLKDGHKWRLTNLYFLARLLEIDPVVGQLVLTEIRGGMDGYLVGSCTPNELRQHVELGVPGYLEASQSLHLPAGLDLSDLTQADVAAQAFASLVQALAKPPGLDDDLVTGYVTSDRIRTILGGSLGVEAVEVIQATLTPDEIRAIVGSNHRFVPTTTNARVTGFVDRDAVALTVARNAIARG